MQWVRDLHPDIFVVGEWSNDASRPFSTSLVERVFDFNSIGVTANDLICRPESSPSSPNPTGRAQLMDIDLNAPCEPPSQSTLTGFYVGLPQSRLKDPWSIESGLRHSAHGHVEVQDMLVIERFVTLRTLLVVTAFDDEIRFTRAKHHSHWLKLLRKHRFEESPVTPTLVQELYDRAKTYRRYFQVNAADGGACLTTFGVPQLYASVWSAPE